MFHRHRNDGEGEPQESTHELLREEGGVLLLSCYELGRQPLGLASTAAVLEAGGFRPSCLDLSVEHIDPQLVARARLVAISVPMHTALRIGVAVSRRVRGLNPECHIAFYGLYALLNAGLLLEESLADSVIGGEFESPLLALAERLAAEENARATTAPGERIPPAPPAHLGPHLERVPFKIPSRSGLPSLERYAHLERNGERLPAASIEASRGCLHLCRHCPIPPVYGGRFFIVPREVVLADVDQLVAAGACHLTFGDPDFLNGPGHVMAITREIHRRHQDLTFDVTTKVGNIIKHRDLFPELSRLGCVFVVSAVESLSDVVLARLDKGHTRSDVGAAIAVLREAGIPLRPTFVPFTPWSTADDYLELLDFVEVEGLIDHVDPVQYALRLLLPPGSLLLDDPSLWPALGGLDSSGFSYRWTHPDPGMDRLQREVSAHVASAAERGSDPMKTFYEVRGMAAIAFGGPDLAAGRAVPTFPAARDRRRPPRLTEDWFC